MSHSPSVRWIHCVLLACVLIEVLELELFAGGYLHHIWDAIVVVIYAYAAGELYGHRGVTMAVLVLGGAPWTMDLLGLQWAGADMESFLWFLSHVALSLVLVRRLLKVTAVSSIEVLDAVSLYILVGLAFANLYGMILWNHPGALAHTTVPPGERPPHGLVLYYSFITQLTVGYGDMAPTHRLTRTVSIVQGLFGVMYLATLISWLVSLHSAAHLSRRH